MQPSTALKLSAALVAGALLVPSSEAQTLRAQRIISGLSNPTWVGSPPTDDRIFVLEQSTDLIKVYTSSGSLIGTFLNVATAGGASGSGERGSLSMAFDPDYANNGYFYVYYTYGANGSRIERYTVSAGNPDVADATSGQTVIELTQPQSNHNGGNIQFGIDDGLLYFAWGDGGGAGDSACNSQKGGTLLGKMIRIDPHGDDFPADATKNYAIPASNPFVGDPTILDEIWALGLRNPWRWSFDPHTGDAYIGDVGQDAREEISFGPVGVGGLNYGWKVMEGNACFSTSSCPAGTPSCGSPVLTDPIHDYIHTGGFGGPCTVIGGVVYRGCAIPEEYGTYFFAEHCDGNIWTFSYDPTTGVSDFQDRTLELTALFGISSIRSFGYDYQGEVLIADSNEVFRVVEENSSFLPTGCDISVSNGGIQDWALDAGTASAGQLYFIGGSLTGTAGIPSGSVVIPLTLDGYTIYTLTHPNQAPLLSTFASLDGSGQATASFNIGPGLLPPSVVGTRAFHAYASLDAGFTANFASNPVSIYFQP